MSAPHSHPLELAGGSGPSQFVMEHDHERGTEKHTHEVTADGKDFTSTTWLDKPVDPDLPDAWMIAHHRATDTLNFGPFDTIDEAVKFVETNRGVSPNFIPLYKTVDWNRR